MLDWRIACDERSLFDGKESSPLWLILLVVVVVVGGLWAIIEHPSTSGTREDVDTGQFDKTPWQYL